VKLVVVTVSVSTSVAAVAAVAVTIMSTIAAVRGAVAVSVTAVSAVSAISMTVSVTVAAIAAVVPVASVAAVAAVAEVSEATEAGLEFFLLGVVLLVGGDGECHAGGHEQQYEHRLHLRLGPGRDVDVLLTLLLTLMMSSAGDVGAHL